MKEINEIIEKHQSVAREELKEMDHLPEIAKQAYFKSRVETAMGYEILRLRLELKLLKEMQETTNRLRA